MSRATSISPTTPIDCSVGGFSDWETFPFKGEIIIKPIGTFTGNFTVWYSLDNGTNKRPFDPDQMVNKPIDDITIFEEGSGVPYIQIEVLSGGSGTVQFEFQQK